MRVCAIPACHITAARHTAEAQEEHFTICACIALNGYVYGESQSMSSQLLRDHTGIGQYNTRNSMYVPKHWMHMINTSQALAFEIRRDHVRLQLRMLQRYECESFEISLKAVDD
jgi:hypothetical protein